MAYTPTTWIDGSTPINASNLNKIEQGVDVADQAAVDAAAAAAAAQTTANAAIPKALVDAKGDLIGATTDNTPARIPVGTDGQVLTVDLAQPLGLKYAAPAAGGADLSYDGDWVAGTYQDGDVVVKDGVAYLCVGGPTTVAPDIAPWGNAGLSLVGDELGYVEVAADVTVAVAAPAAAQTIFTFPAISFDGATPILIAIDFPLVSIAGGANYLIFNLWDGSTDLGTVLQIRGDVALGNYGSRRLIPSAGTHSYTIRGYGYGGAGQILSAPASARLPAYARMTRVVPSPPQFPVTPLTPPTYGTSLPASPTDGQEAILVDSVVNPSYQWRFRYNAGSTSAYKWEFIGGAPRGAGPQGDMTLAGGSGDTPLTGGPTFVLPRNGDYRVQWGLSARKTSATAGALITDVWDGVGGGVGRTVLGTTALDNFFASATFIDLKTTMVAARTLAIRAAAPTASAGGQFTQGWLLVTPVRVS